MASPVVDPFFLCPCLTKKLTVTGIIGQTQGIARANSPPRAHAMRKGMIPSLALLRTSPSGGLDSPFSRGLVTTVVSAGGFEAGAGVTIGASTFAATVGAEGSPA